MLFFFFFKQKTAYEIRPCDWSSDVCSSDLPLPARIRSHAHRQRQSLRARGHSRSEERRVGKECTVLCRSRWSPYHKNKKMNIHRPGRRTSSYVSFVAASTEM